MEAIIWLLVPLVVTVAAAGMVAVRSLRFRTESQRRARRRSQLRRIESVLRPPPGEPVPSDPAAGPADVPADMKDPAGHRREKVLEDSD